MNEEERQQLVWGDVLSAAKAKWIGLSVNEVKIVPTEASALVVPFLISPVKEVNGDWIFKPKELAAWFEKPSIRGKLWRTIGRLFKRDDWRRRGMFPAYKNTWIKKEEILLERVAKFQMGYGPQTQALAVRAFKDGDIWQPVIWDERT